MLGSRIESLRKAGNITQTELSRVIGVSKSAVSMYESSKRQPEYEVLCRVADYFGVSVDYLLGRGGGGGYENAVSRAKACGVSEPELLVAIDFIMSTKKAYDEGEREA